MEGRLTPATRPPRAGSGRVTVPERRYMMSFSKPPQLSEQIALHLRDQILTGQLRPDSYIRPHLIAEQFDTSVTPVREALFLLKQEGFIALTPRKGFVVKPISTQDIIDMFRLQAFISGELASRAALNISLQEIDQLKAVHEKYVEAVERTDDEAIFNRNREFHKMINLAANAPKLAIAFVNAARFTPRKFFSEHEAFFHDAVDEHQRMIDAFEARDAEFARAEMVTHVSRAGEVVEQRFKDGTSMAVPFERGLPPGFTPRSSETARV